MEAANPLTDSSVGKDVVDAAVEVVGMLEKRNKVCPLRHIGLDERERAVLQRRRDHITTDYCRTQGQEELRSRKSNP